MRRRSFNIIIGALLAVTFAVCSSCGRNSCIITMTTETDDEVELLVYGKGVVTVDWGDGSEKDIMTFGEDGLEFHHDYSGAAIYTIMMSGDSILALRCDRCELTSLDVSKNRALVSLDCSSNQLTGLDVSRNKALSSLDCSNNQLTSLDVSKNTALSYLDCSSNQLTSLDMRKNTALTFLLCKANLLTTAALNSLFETLHNNTIPRETKEIYIYSNSGEKDCDRSIAMSKGWAVL